MLPMHLVLSYLTWRRALRACATNAPPRVPLSERTFSPFLHHQAAATQWGAEDELVGPAILSRLGLHAEVRDGISTRSSGAKR